MASLKPIETAQQPVALPTLESIVELSNSDMADLSRAALIQIVEAVQQHLPQPDWAVATRECDEATLLKMAFCARECCRHLLTVEQQGACDCEDSCSCPHCG